MSMVEELIREVEAAGISIRPDPPDLIVKPADRLTAELETRLKEHKPELMAYLSRTKPADLADLEGSMRRLEAASVSIAVWEDGRMRVLVTEADTLGGIKDAGTIYSPHDMYYYVQLTPPERRMLHAFKKKFGGSIEWKGEYHDGSNSR
jgi:hypothetical protein